MAVRAARSPPEESFGPVAQRIEERDSAKVEVARSNRARSTNSKNSYGVAELARREFLKLVYVGSNPTSVANLNRFDAEYTGVVKPPGTDS